MKIIVILHGWGRHFSGATYSKLKNLLAKKNFDVYAPDLPGFGTNASINKDLNFDDYIIFVNRYIKDLIQKKKINKVTLFGHSFGGRIAIKLTSLYPELVEKLILVGASGIPRPLPSLKKRTVYFITKLLRPLFLVPPFSAFYIFLRKLTYYSIGEMDYYKAGPLAQTFKNVYKVSIVDSLPKIKVPTLIVWGVEDKVTPLADGKFMHRNIQNSKFVIIKGEGHKLPYNSPQKVVDEITLFLT